MPNYDASTTNVVRVDLPLPTTGATPDFRQIIVVSTDTLVVNLSVAPRSQAGSGSPQTLWPGKR